MGYAGKYKIMLIYKNHATLKKLSEIIKIV